MATNVSTEKISHCQVPVMSIRQADTYSTVLMPWKENMKFWNGKIWNKLHQNFLAFITLMKTCLHLTKLSTLGKEELGAKGTPLVSPGCHLRALQEDLVGILCDF